MASVALLLSFANLFIGTALAATDDKTRLGNSTIDRVRYVDSMDARGTVD